MVDYFKSVPSWPKPSRDQCDFYTCMDFPDGEKVEGVNWDIRGRYEHYIGNYDVKGKSVLDVGTASGFLAFNAEKAGARSVTVYDADDASEFNRIPFARSKYTDHRAQWVADTNIYLNRLKSSFWYGWHKYGSSAKAVYAPASKLWQWDQRFDIVIAGAIVEHMSDPIQFISSLASLAKEVIIIAFTPVLPDTNMIMRPMNNWDNPVLNYSWWELSIGLYQRIFSNLGFLVELVPAQALCNEYSPPILVDRPTIIARRC